MKIKSLFSFFTLAICFFGFFQSSNAQDKKILVVPDIPCSGIAYDAGQMANLFRMEIGKTGIYSVIGYNEMEQTLQKSGFSLKNCYSRSCLVELGKILQAGAIFSGSVDRYGEKIVIVLQILNGTTGAPEKTSVSEFYNAQQYIEQMVETAVKKLFGLPVDKYLEATLLVPQYIIMGQYNKIMARGPRMGLTYITGLYGRRLNDPFSTGGQNILPLLSVFGYQYEEQYMSAGNVVGLVDFFTFVAGIESGMFIPGTAIITGLRHQSTGIEFGIGPAGWIYRGTRGFFDEEGRVNPDKPGRWYSLFDDPAGMEYYNTGNNKEYFAQKTLPDKRGEIRGAFSLLYSIGKTFHFGSMDIPLNIYIVSTKKDFMVTLATGFNVKKNTKKKD